MPQWVGEAFLKEVESLDQEHEQHIRRSEECVGHGVRRIDWRELCAVSSEPRSVENFNIDYVLVNDYVSAKQIGVLWLFRLSSPSP